MRISDWSSDVCSSVLGDAQTEASGTEALPAEAPAPADSGAPRIVRMTTSVQRLQTLPRPTYAIIPQGPAIPAVPIVPVATQTLPALPHPLAARLLHPTRVVCGTGVSAWLGFGA